MSTITLNPYLQFNGKAEEALEFYQSIFGGESTISRFSDIPEMANVSEENKNLVMHADLQAPSLRLMLSDAASADGITIGNNISMSLSGDDDSVLTGYFEALSADGKVNEPLKAAPWGDKFGMVTDKFGINWLFNIGSAKN